MDSHNKSIVKASFVLHDIGIPIDIVLRIVEMVQVPKPQKVTLVNICGSCEVCDYQLCTECEKYYCDNSSEKWRSTYTDMCYACDKSNEKELHGEVPFREEDYMPRYFSYSGGIINKIIW